MKGKYFREDPDCGCLQDEPCKKHKKQFLEGKISHWPPEKEIDE